MNIQNILNAVRETRRLLNRHKDGLMARALYARRSEKQLRLIVKETKRS